MNAKRTLADRHDVAAILVEAVWTRLQSARFFIEGLRYVGKDCC